MVELARAKLRAFAGTIDHETGEYLDDVYAQNKSLAEHVAADYHGRFLIELVQNGHDAHPRGMTDGGLEIELVLSEGDCGTLYVANRGDPFTHDNLVALARIGMSSKPPGEAIGNKGLGFRSVSHVCDAPEIYSQAENGGARRHFEGFCFTFARQGELSELISDPNVLKLARSDLPIFFLPRPLTCQNAKVRAFAARGFATVIRLPLRDAPARQTAVNEIAALESDRAPLLLFLERIAMLEVRIIDETGEARTTLSLSRCEKAVDGAPLAASLCALTGSQWLLLRDEIDEPSMWEAITDGVGAKQLHGSWADWRGPGEVALAVRLDAAVETPRLYTHLPMGDGAAAPFSGHLHGTFFPTSNRKALDASVALNRLLLNRASLLAAKAVLWLAGEGTWGGTCLDPAARARASVDLLVWATPSSLIAGTAARDGALDLGRAIVTALEQHAGAKFDAVEAIPCAMLDGDAIGVDWCAPSHARGSLEESATFDLKAVAHHSTAIGIAIISPVLGPTRHAKLSAFLRKNAPDTYRDSLSAEERASIAAGIAGTMRAGSRPDLARWAAFYRDLAVFLADAPGAVRTKCIILCDDGSVRGGQASNDSGMVPGRRRRRARRGTVEPSLFFPPTPRSVGEPDGLPPEQLVVPKQLTDYFAFASSALPWHGELRAAREFLEKASVSAYDGEAVLTRIAQVVNSGATVEQALAGLRWAFAIWRRAADINRPIKVDGTYRLLVPNAEQALIPASDAIFSESWPEHLLGKRIYAFLSAAPPELPDLAALRAQRLAPISHRAFGRARIPQWAEFLESLGVRRGLHPVALPTMPRTRAWEVTSLSFASALGVSGEAAKEWRQDLHDHLSEALRLGYSTHYKFQGPLWWLPGQGQHHFFTDECRELYAGLIVEWLARASIDQLRVTLAHEYYSSDTRVWPTPAGAFVRSAAWIPTDDPSPTGVERHHHRPADVWVAAGSERFPPYLRQVATSVGRAIERRQPEALQQLIRWGHMRVLHSRETLVQQLAFLAEQYAAGGVGRYYEPQLANLYASTWRGVAERHANEPGWLGSAHSGLRVLARRRGELAVLLPGKDTPPVYVRDTDDELAPSLIDAVQAYLLDVRSADRAKIGGAVEALLGKSVVRLSQLRYRIFIDGTALEEAAPSTAVLGACPWLRPMLAVAMEALKGTDASQLPADRTSVLDRLATVALIKAETVSFELDGRAVVGPVDRLAYLFRGTGGEPLVVSLHSGFLDWSTLDACLPAICDAVDLPSVATGMRLLAWVLRDADEEVDAATLDDAIIGRLCRALGVDATGEASVRLFVGEQAGSRLPWLRAALHYAGGEKAVTALRARELARDGDVHGLIADLRPIAAAAGLDVDRLLEATRRALSTGQFRDLLDFDFGRFNDSLSATGSDPVTHPDLHASQLLNHVVEREVTILEALRNMAVEKLERFEPDPRYRDRRDRLRALPPDPDWLNVYHMVPEAELTARITGWLASIGAPALGANPHGLLPLTDVRAANGKAVASFAAVAAPLVRAWWKGPVDTLPEQWRDARSAEQRMRSALDISGAFDVRPLDGKTLLSWARTLGLWPSEMPLSLERGELGLSDDAIDSAAAAARRDADERAAAARSVRFNGRDIDPEKADWSAISAEIAATLSRQVKNARLGAPTSLAQVDKPPPRNKGERKPREDSGGADRTPAAKKEAIGRLGELVVYHWLKERYPNQDIDKAWVSGNATDQHAKAGSDSLGYDFRLELDRRTWLIEVKASQGDRCRFEMAESEVREARRAARPRSKERYVVIYVADPGDSSLTRLDVLPNPLSEEGAAVLDLLGEGIRYGFRRTG